MSSEICMHAALAAGAAAGSYIFHCAAAEAVVYENAGGQVSGATALHRPVLLLTRHQLVALTSGGIRLAAALPLRGADRGPTPSHPVFKSLSASDQMVWYCMTTAARFALRCTSRWQGQPSVSKGACTSQLFQHQCCAPCFRCQASVGPPAPSAEAGELPTPSSIRAARHSEAACLCVRQHVACADADSAAACGEGEWLSELIRSPCYHSRGVDSLQVLQHCFMVCMLNYGPPPSFHALLCSAGEALALAEVFTSDSTVGQSSLAIQHDTLVPIPPQTRM